MYTNADSKVTDEDRRKDDQLQHNKSIVEKAERRTTTEGVGSNPQLLTKDAQVPVTFDQMSDKKGEEWAPIIPIAFEKNSRGGVDWILTPYQYAMVMQGKVCAKCLEWQDDRIQTLTCRFRGKDYGCGHKRNIDTDIMYERLKK